MFMKYTFQDIKKLYDNAQKTFTAKGGSGTKTDPSFFNSKLYLKFLLSNYKSIQKLETGKNSKYFKLLEDSAGDYNRRKGGNIVAQTREHVVFCKNLISKNPILKYSIVGVFCDTYDIVTDSKWKSAFKAAYAHAKKMGDNKTLASAYKALYISLVLSMEEAMLHIIDLEFSIYAGIGAEDAVMQVHLDNKSFMSKVVSPTISLLAFCASINPNTAVDTVIAEETAAKKSNEGFFETMHQIGSVAKNVGVHLIPFASIVAGGFVAFFTGGAIPVAVGLWVIAAMLIIPNTRMIIYYVNVSKVDLEKELELHSEMLNNNINDLKKQLDNASSKEEKDRIQKVIDHQVEMYKHLQEELKNNSSDLDSDSTDNELNGDETSTENSIEDDDSSTNSGSEDSSSNDGGFDISI